MLLSFAASLALVEFAASLCEARSPAPSAPINTFNLLKDGNLQPDLTLKGISLHLSHDSDD